jgi:hypothetical protein
VVSGFFGVACGADAAGAESVFASVDAAVDELWWGESGFVGVGTECECKDAAAAV